MVVYVCNKLKFKGIVLTWKSKETMRFNVFILVCSLFTAYTDAETTTCANLEKKVQLLETKLNQLLTKSEQHERDLKINEKRIESLENILRRSIEKLTESYGDLPPNAANKQDTAKDKEISNITSSAIYHSGDVNAEKEGIKQRTSRLLSATTLGKASSSGDVAFYSYLSTEVTQPGQQQIIIFDVLKTNIGNAYSSSNGVFTARYSGLYHFSWTIYVYCRGYVYTEIVKNSEVYGHSLADSEDICDNHSSTANVIIDLVEGDVVFIRTNSKYRSPGNIISDDRKKSTFSGFMLK